MDKWDNRDKKLDSRKKPTKNYVDRPKRKKRQKRMDKETRAGVTKSSFFWTA